MNEPYSQGRENGTDTNQASEDTHKTLNGWCCACEADQAFMEAEIERQVKSKLAAIYRQHYEAIDKAPELLSVFEDKLKERDDE